MLIKDKLLPPFNKAVSYLKTKSVCEGILNTKEAEIDILVALMPASVFGCVLFGWYSILILVLSVGFALLTDFLWNVILKKEIAPPHISSAVIGLLFGMCLPPKVPFWIAVIGSIFTVAISKWLNNHLIFTNSAVISKAVLTLIFPSAFSAFAEPFTNNPTAETPLAYLSESSAFVPSAKYMFFGLQSGNIAETSVFLLLVGALYLIIRKIISPVAPLCFVGTLTVLSLIFGDALSVSLMGGGLFMGALFLTSTYTKLPSENYKKIIFGLLCGILTFVLRLLFNPNNSIVYAIIIANLIVFLSDKNNITKIIYFIKSINFDKIKSQLSKLKKSKSDSTV